MQNEHDPELGAMTCNGEIAYDSSWVLEKRVAWNGHEVRVEIDPEEPDTRAISPLQRQAAMLILALSPADLVRAAPAVVQNYEIYREALGDDECPPLAQPEDVWKQVNPKMFLVPRHFDETQPCFFLYAECDWDPEHGLEVRFRNGLADAASQRGDLHLSD